MSKTTEIGAGRFATADELKRFEEAWAHADGCECAVCKSVAGMILLYPEPIKRAESKDD